MYMYMKYPGTHNTFPSLVCVVKTYPPIDPIVAPPPPPPILITLYVSLL